MIKTVHHVVVSKIVSAASLIFLTTFFFTACKVYKPAYYFKDIKNDTIIKGFVTNDLELKIQKNDVLSIAVSSLNTEEDNLFNNRLSGSAPGGKSGYQVNTDGNIYLHKLGKIAVAGLTRKELKTSLETSLLPFLKDPIVTINFANHRLTVLGEAASVVIEMPDEKISLPEVMAKSGAVTVNTQLNKIMIIRETPNAKQVKYLNLEDPSVFTSPWYYLQPNDIVVVKPNEEKMESEQRRTRNQLMYTTVISAITFVFLIIDRIFR